MFASQPILALDFGGTKLSAALTTPELLAKRRWLESGRTFDVAGIHAQNDLQALLLLSRQLLGDKQPAAVGVSFGGPVDATNGIVRLSHHVPGWENFALRSYLEAEFHCPTAVDNDANIAALGEYRYGAGMGVNSLLYITVSTGVGGGWILDGKIWQGVQGMAGEIGHMTIDPAGPLCLCGKHGCVERLASGPYLAQDARLALTEDPNQGPEILRLCGGFYDQITAELLSRATEAGDPLAIQLITRSAWAIGTGIGNAANLINPRRAILGGGVTKAGAAWWEEVRRSARAVMLPEVEIEILPAQLGDDAPLWGAVALALESMPDERG